jgi:hypothetical protein
MASKSIRTNFRVEVTPRHPGDFGFASVSGQPYPEAEQELDCQHIADQIKRHVDGLPSWNNRGVAVIWDTETTCEHCGAVWTEEDSTYNGGCCAADENGRQA